MHVLCYCIGREIKFFRSTHASNVNKNLLEGKGEICVEKVTNKHWLVLNFREMNNIDLWIRLSRFQLEGTDVAINIMKIALASM